VIHCLALFIFFDLQLSKNSASKITLKNSGSKNSGFFSFLFRKKTNKQTMNNNLQKAYVWVKYLFCFGFDPLYFAVIINCVGLILVSTWLTLYNLFKWSISYGIFNCTEWTRNIGYTIVPLENCTSKLLHDTSKDNTVISMALIAVFMFFSFAIGTMKNKDLTTTDNPFKIELEEIDEEEKKEK
jgi:hypothetical protein